jgi:hypothetical protein
MLTRYPSRRVAGAAELPEPAGVLDDEPDEPDEPHPAARTVAAATPAAIRALFIVRLFSKLIGFLSV